MGYIFSGDVMMQYTGEKIKTQTRKRITLMQIPWQSKKGIGSLAWGKIGLG